MKQWPELPRILPYSLGGGVPLGSRKSCPLLDQILQILWPSTRPKIFNYSWFQSFMSDPVKRDPILDQFSMITRPYTRPNGLKTIPSTRPNGLKTIPFTNTKWLENRTLSSGTYPYSQYMGVFPHSPLSFCGNEREGFLLFLNVLRWRHRVYANTIILFHNREKWLLEYSPPCFAMDILPLFTSILENNC